MTCSLFDPAHYQTVRKSLLQASTLPPVCYTSPRFFDREIERIFLRNWQFVGREEQLAAPGEYICHDGVGGSVIILRDADMGLRAYANSCRHRGSRLLDGDGRCRRIVCPYHGWSYRLDGRLVGTPGMQQAENFDPGDYPLIELPLDTWAGFIFIHYAGSPPPLAQYLGSMVDRFASHRGDEMRHVGSLEFDIDANWKLLAENALEAYHTGSVHRATLGQQDSRPVDTSGNWTALLVEDEQSVATLPGEDKSFPHIDGLDAEARAGACFTLVYPSTQLVFAQDCLWWLAFSPVMVDRTRLTLGACFPQSTIRLPGFEDRVKPYFERWRLATAEDNAICEVQQQGQRLAREPGRFAPGEFAVHAFSNWVLDQVLER
ncbi:MAG: aromatic ring-hydroxylating dioxygenase subunit alpha [Gammaproteobacteria bacterium]|nr:aromatic ring-hydroxylating dioxygenase subunit alpha [Gammaproteobacteria bacterium]MDH3447527.1 aromatic ring-hydroxylating dioxygenase subunit alpha [Gammaproteobacteria bacterium]